MLEINECRVQLYEPDPIDLDPSKILDVERRSDGTIRVFYYEFGDETYECGVEKGDGEPCEMNVDSPAERCHHHE
jgi:hypothetical protein